MIYICNKCKKKTSHLICENCSFDNTSINQRFVKNNYLSNFSFEWKIHSKTQFEEFNAKVPSSETFFLRTKKQPNFFQNKKILDAGVGSGRFSAVPLKYGAKVWGVDLSEAYLVAAKNFKHQKNYQSLQADISAMPFADEQFDYIFSFGVIHHSPDPKACLKEMFRVLKPGGEICVTVYPSYGMYFTSKFIRKITTKIPQKLLYLITTMYVCLFYVPYKYFFLKHSFIGKLIPISLSNSFKEAILDTYDCYSPKYQHTFHSYEMYEILSEIGFTNITPRPHPITMAAKKPFKN